MSEFVLINITNCKKIDRYQNDMGWNKVFILPYYADVYVCFSRLEMYGFEQLMQIFMGGNDDEQIGSISLIAEYYPSELYQYLTVHGDTVSKRKKYFLMEKVIPDYLPIYLPSNKLHSFNFNPEEMKNIWVRILQVLK